MPSPRLRRSPWLVPLLLFLAVVLGAGLAFNLANLDTGGEAVPAPPSAGSTSGAAPWPLDPVLLISAVGLVFLVLFAVGVFFALRGGRPGRESRVRPLGFWEYFGSLFAFAALFLILVLWPRTHPAGGTNGTSSTDVALNGTASNLPAVAGIPAAFFLAGSLLGAIVILMFFLRTRSAPAPVRRHPTVLLADRAEADGAVQAAIHELEIGADVRSAILGCYGRFCRLLGEKGLRAQETMTPREIEALSVQRLGVGDRSAAALTGLFEEARYSDHILGAPSRDRALECLTEIRTDLEG